MKKNTIILMIALLSFGACDFPPDLSKKFKRPAPRSELSIVNEEQVQLAQAVMWAKPSKIVLKRDIFKPLILSSAAFSKGSQESIASDISMLELSGTLVSENSVAFIRNKAEKKNYVVREKGFVSSFQVAEINQKGVRLTKDGKDFYLKIPEAKK